MLDKGPKNDMWWAIQAGQPVIRNDEKIAQAVPHIIEPGFNTCAPVKWLTPLSNLKLWIRRSSVGFTWIAAVAFAESFSKSFYMRGNVSSKAIYSIYFNSEAYLHRSSCKVGPYNLNWGEAFTLMSAFRRDEQQVRAARLFDDPSPQIFIIRVTGCTNWMVVSCFRLIEALPTLLINTRRTSLVWLPNETPRAWITECFKQPHFLTQLGNSVFVWKINYLCKLR